MTSARIEHELLIIIFDSYNMSQTRNYEAKMNEKVEVRTWRERKKIQADPKKHENVIMLIIDKMSTLDWRSWITERIKIKLEQRSEKRKVLIWMVEEDRMGWLTCTQKVRTIRFCLWNAVSSNYWFIFMKSKTLCYKIWNKIGIWY